VADPEDVKDAVTKDYVDDELTRNTTLLTIKCLLTSLDSIVNQKVSANLPSIPTVLKQTEP
jgi:hypothetical protein